MVKGENNLQLRIAITGYNKKDVENLVKTMAEDHAKQIAEYKKRFSEAMKVVDAKDDKCYLLETKLSEMNVKLQESGEKLESVQASKDNVSQLLESLETQRVENVKLSGELEELKAKFEKVSEVADDEKIAAFEAEKAELELQLAEIDEIKAERDKLATDFAELEKAYNEMSSGETDSADIQSNLFAENQKLQHAYNAMFKEHLELKEKFDELEASSATADPAEVEDIKRNLNILMGEKAGLQIEMSKLIAEKEALANACNSYDQQVKDQQDIIDAYESDSRVEVMTPAKRAAGRREPQSYDMLTVDAIQYAGQIILDAKKDAQKTVDGLKDICETTQEQVRRINEAIKRVHNQFRSSIVNVEDLLVDIERDAHKLAMEAEAEKNMYQTEHVVAEDEPDFVVESYDD